MKKMLYVATVDSHIKAFHLPYLKLLHDNKYEVHVATNGNDTFPNCDVKHQICIERSPFKLSNIKAIRQLKKIIDKEKFSLIHCHTPMGAVVARLAARKARKKYGTRVIYTAHGFHFYKGAPLLNWLLFYPIEKWLAKYTDTLITINKEDYELAKDKFNKRCHDIEYVPGIGVDEKKFNVELSDKEKIDLKKLLNLDKNDFVLTCVARLDKNKNQGFLINVVEQLTKKYSNIHLLLVGPDELNGYYHQMVDEKGLNNNIHFLGSRSDIPRLLSITDIVLSASLREGLPVNVLESFASGKPVVVLNCRGMNDLIKNGKNGYIVFENNVEQFKLAVEKIYNNTNLQIKISENNKKDCNNYCIEVITKYMENIYKKQKKVLHVLVSNKFSGAENVVCTIIDNLCNEYKMAYCSVDGPIRETLENRNIKFYGMKKLSIKNLNKVIEEFKPDIIHAHDYTASFYVAKTRFKGKIISHLHNNCPFAMKWNLKTIAYASCIKRFSKIVGVSNKVYEEAVFKHKISNKYTTIYNYVDKDYITNKTSEYKYDKKYDIYFIGRLTEQKNPLLFLEIIKNVSNDNGKIKACMIGDGELKELCIKYIEDNKLNRNVDMLGFVSNPFPIIKNCKICIMPSKWEGFGLTAIESMILNKPVLNSGVGGLSEIFKDNDEFICKDLNDYVNKIEKMINVKISNNITEKFCNKNKWKEKIKELYD